MMAISTSPRKVVPLSTGEERESRPRPIPLSSTPAVTKRAFFCGVVVEGPNDGEDLSDDIQDLVASLGDRLTTDYNDNNASQNTSTSSTENLRSKEAGKPNAAALADLVGELVSTEETYVERLRILKTLYADRLRSYARDKDTAIIPAYVANTLFGNIDQIFPANDAFLNDLRKMRDEPHMVGGVGDITLRHFRDLRAFDCYKNYYAKREEAQVLFKQVMSKKSQGGFAAFVERTKYQIEDAKNRVGLRELMMEPVQRIPRYTLLFRSMIKIMDPRDPQRAKLAEAVEVASRIALAETDDHTKLAATLNCLSSSIEGFPPDLIKSSRKFIECIDVEDNVADGYSVGPGSNPYSSVSSSAASINSNQSGGGILHCTLFLFDDKLMIVKRPNSDKSGRVLAGLDDVEKLTSGAFSLRGFLKKSVMVCKGVVDLTDVVATDVSGSDMHFYFESPLSDQSDRWSGRPLRFFSVVHPPSPVNHDPMRAENDKRRFLDNLWRVQARFRTKLGQSVALRGDDQKVDDRGGKITIARTYFNVYQRTSFLKEAKKTKIVLHIDSLGRADPLPFGLNDAPYVIVRVHPIEGDLSHYCVTSSDPDDEEERTIIPTSAVPGRIVQTIHQYGLFRFRTQTASRPATPSSSRSRAHLFSIDVISKNLFGAFPGSKGDRDVFGSDNSYGSHRRSKSAISRSSTRTDTTTTGTMDSMRFSSRSNSTAATSMSSFAEDDDSFGERSVAKSRKLVKRNRSRSRSPGFALGADSGEERMNSSMRRSRANSVANMDFDGDEYRTSGMPEKREVNQSELDLTRRLELARRNSRNQHGLEPPPNGVMEVPVEETIYEEEPPLPLRPLSRASRSTSTTHERDGCSMRSNTPPTTRSITPTPRTPSPSKSRAESLHTNDRRPLGPRPPSPLPPLSPSMPSMPTPPMDIDIEKALENTIARLHPDHLTPENGERETINPPTPSPLPRSRRQPFDPTGNTEATPKSSKAIEPLSIKKKTSNASATRPNMSPTLSRKQHVRNTPLSRSPTKQLYESPPRRPSPVLENQSEEVRRRLLRLAETTKIDIESSNRSVKRIRLELSSCPSTSQADEGNKSLTRTNPSTPTRVAAATNEARSRMEEMQKLIGQRQSAIPRRTKTLEPSLSTRSVESTSGDSKAWVKTIDDLASSAQGELDRATRNFDAFKNDLEQLACLGPDNSSELEKCRTELRGSKRQCELLKNLLNDSTAENEIMYQAFNEELDGMFNDANLPDDEAWTAMSSDLQKSKEERNRLTRENAQLKRKIQEVESQRDEWASLLREQGLIP